MTWLPHALGWLLLGGLACVAISQSDDLGRRAVLALSVIAAAAFGLAFIVLVSA